MIALLIDEYARGHISKGGTDQDNATWASDQISDRVDNSISERVRTRIILVGKPVTNGLKIDQVLNFPVGRRPLASFSIKMIITYKDSKSF